MIADIVYEATYAHPREAVWRALTTSELLAAWLMANDLREARVGHTFRFTDRPRPFWNGVCSCEVLVADAPSRFELAWGTDAPGTATRASWTLAATPDGGTRLTFCHSGLHGVMGWLMKLGMSKGWRRMVERSIPFVLDEMTRGRTPTRDAVKQAALHGA
ncbi:MAG: SRPBCC domain-containing protein [Polyangiales bacterium]